MEKFKCMKCENIDYYTKTAINTHIQKKHKELWAKFKADKNTKIFDIITNDNDPQQELHKSIEKPIERLSLEEPTKPVSEDKLQGDLKVLEEKAVVNKAVETIAKIADVNIIQNEQPKEVKKMEIFDKIKTSWNKSKSTKANTKVAVRKENNLQETLDNMPEVYVQTQPLQELSMRCIIADARHQRQLNNILTDFMVENGITVKQFLWRPYEPPTITSQQPESKRYGTLSPEQQEQLGQGNMF